MKQKELVEKYKALTALTEVKLPVKKAYSVYKLRQKLETSFTFVANEEQKAIKDCNAEVQLDGKITFKEISDAIKYRDRMKEVTEMDEDIEIEPVTLTEKDLGDAAISPADIAALEGFVNFEFDEGK